MLGHELRIALGVDELGVFALQIGVGDPTGLRAAPSGIDGYLMVECELPEPVQALALAGGGFLRSKHDGPPWSVVPGR